MAASAALVGLLGLGHLGLTYVGPKLLPRDPSLKDAMDRVSPVISGEMTIWQAWIGFNVSHSMGALLFGLVYGYLALFHGEMLFHSRFLELVGLAMLAGYVTLARRYWFRTPFIGTALALTCYLVSLAWAHAG